MSDQIDPREYGRLEQQVTQLTADVHAMRDSVEEIKDFMQQNKGGWKTIAVLGGVAGSMGALISWIAAYWRTG